MLSAHHDGSGRYVSNPNPSLGERVTVWLRVPHAARAEQVFVRTTPDAEPHWDQAIVDREGEHETWWRVDVRVTNPIVRYRFLLLGGAGEYRWVNAAGTFAWDVPDANDFWLTTAPPAPAWLDEAIVYQIFPDRFASSGTPRHWPSWAIPSEWDGPLDPDWRRSTRQMFGGDLAGVEAHLDHIAHLGANTIYLTPFFPAESAHRYNAESFERVDPLLGGDAALTSLSRAIHARGMRLVGDLTTNHTGDTHAWFQRARADRDSEEASYYFFDGDGPDDYVGWFGVKTLPKLDHRAPALQRAMLDGPASIAGRWLAEPYALDGWRIDVANMTGRLADIDRNHDVARALRATMAAANPDTWLVAEHCYDASADLRGDGWHGTMNYSGFTRPIWTWLGDPASKVALMGYPTRRMPRLGGRACAATMRAFTAAMPWRSTTASMNLLGSHDTARWRTAAGSREAQLAGAALLATMPGVPMICYGDEVGVEGATSDLGRVPMPWDESRWDLPTLDAYRSLLGLRAHSEALRRGGLRWLHADDESIVFVRESDDDAVLVHVARAAHPPLTVDLAAAGLGDDAAAMYGTLNAAADGSLALQADGPTANIIHLGALSPSGPQGASHGRR